jgi:hypothetical protein
MLRHSSETRGIEAPRAPAADRREMTVVLKNVGWCLAGREPWDDVARL